MKSRKKTTVLMSILGVLASGLCPVGTAFAYSTNQSASVALGQNDLSGRAFNIDTTQPATGLRQPYGMTTDGTHVVVGDYANNRVLIWNSIPTTSGVAPDVVVGQTSMTGVSANQGGSASGNTLSGPTQVVIAGTKLLITDSTNNRILIFNTIPTTNNAKANVVIGQPDKTTVTSGTSQTKLKLPEAVSYDPDSGKVMVSDWNNSRVLIYNSMPTSDGAAADVVLGQINFTSGTANRGGTASGNSLSNPYNTHIYQNKLIVADAGNNRILIWNTVPTSNVPADVVIGQTSLTASSANQGGSVSASTLSAPADVIWDGTGSNLLVSDYNNQRVLVFNGIPTSNNASAVKAIGQPNLTSSSKNQGSDLTTAYAYSLRNAAGGFGLTRDYLLIADTGNNRILIYDNLAPSVSSFSPNDNATGVSASANLAITFNEVARAGTGTLTIKRVSDDSTVETITVSGALLSGNGTTQLTLNPITTLAESTSYYVTWDAYAFKDTTGNRASAVTSSTAWNFTTADSTAPSIVSFSPADGATDVSIFKELSLNFDEAVQAGTGSVFLKKSSDNTTVATVAAGAAAVSGAGTQSITVSLGSSLSYETDYYVLVGANAFKDASGNHAAGIASATTWNFKTATEQPSNTGGGRRGSSGRSESHAAPSPANSTPISNNEAAQPATHVAPVQALAVFSLPDALKARLEQRLSHITQPSRLANVLRRLEKRLSRFKR